MATITYVDAAAHPRKVTATTGSVMSIAVQEGLPGIVGECGGQLACASCHVYLDPAWADRIGPPASELEDEMLDGAVCERTANSRPSCQIPVGDAVDGLIVHTAATQV
ncbi:2Fe-2S iron-sulfur cluster-binding protein [Amycolatopsis sp. CA-126428]|uniref:2Fe-2S iron-sulfur cluster-binding protein n=1 Tax=Amycolatopsis sp. CA-126428 TaxID=2073158 RepID=UPI000CD172D2|nr:2Fe-2S iron-sulfur cluster-binding protein [Amycolatopsis sp. CA-126428]